ncbi:uncharacterized protein LOC131154108 isoform X2 [Malania oleifera]|uniref:uncharacterized protein LOC131154108 isoform X2 n=1 Tax=Malania oleifera TaxID=397392 RepID=UPI0025AE056C|nr:uncharacterized protein LOC131154108 isoform X2 [Malania oleifera]
MEISQELVQPEASRLSPSSSGSGRRSSVSSSPEFEFWMVRNPSFPQPNLLSADELFVDGVLLPLRLLPNHSDPPDPNPRPADPDSPAPDPDLEPAPGPQLSSSPPDSSPLTASKRWKDIFKKGDKKMGPAEDKEKRKERKGCSGHGGTSSPELNINLWPFARSRSAGNNGKRVGASGTRKVSSAPCSRSNSGSESKSRKWPSSPGRAGVHLGRTSPVWQVRRGVPSGARSPERLVRNTAKGIKKEAAAGTRWSKAQTSAAPAAGGGGAKPAATWA